MLRGIPNRLSDLASNLSITHALAGVPTGPRSQVYIVDPVLGSDTSSGLDLVAPLKTISAALGKCVTNQNDVVLVVGGPTANLQTATLAWNKSYTHLVGMSAPLPGVGQRTRITVGAAADATSVVTFSGDGCVVKNIQLFNGSDADAIAAAGVVSGNRCYFENVFFAGMGHATPAAKATGYSLGLSGAENTFVRCSIGLGTIDRGAGANTELLMSGQCNRNKFIGCEFLSWSNTAAKALVRLDATAVPYEVQFEDCLFHNFKSNNGATGTALNHAIEDAATPYHAVILRGNCQLIGCAAWADPVTYVLGCGPLPHANQGISIVGA